MKRDRFEKEQAEAASAARVKIGFKGIDFKCYAVIALASVLLAVLFCAAITPERYNLSAGSIAHKTITASKDVIDEVSTAARREAAAHAVEPTYHLKEGASEDVLTDLEGILAELLNAQQVGWLCLEENGPAYTFLQEDIDRAKTVLTTINLSDYQLRSLMRSSPEAFAEMAQVVTAAVTNTLSTTIRAGQVNESIRNILQIVGFRVETDLLQNVVTPVLRRCIQPNMVIEQEATEEAQQKARDEVEPVVYAQGQNIILAGERLGYNQMEMLRSLGLLDDNSIDIRMYAGAFLMVIIAMASMLIPLGMMRHAILQDSRKITILMLIIITTVAVSIGIMNVGNAYLAPLAMSAMLLTGLLGGTVGICGSLCVTILVAALTAGGAGKYASDMVHLLLTGLMAGVIAARFLRRRPQRVRVLLCGLIIAAANALVVFSIGLMTNNDLLTVWNGGIIWSMGSGVISAVLTLALQPLFEATFSLSSQSKLLDIINPNNPLLKRLLLEAAGTYHHSLLVANLAEAASEAIGANPLLTRAGAYFHDVGKLKRPMYFKENQQGDNPHDRTDPYVSAAIITAHPGDGVQLAQKYRLPMEVQQIISEHHGDTPAMFFYHKALQLSNGKPVDIADFRYEGKRPSTKESAVVMLADTVEAAARTLTDPTPQAMEDLIERLIRGKLEDGQLSESPLTLSDIDKICEAFINTLSGAFHQRIEYPMIRSGKHLALLEPQNELNRITESGSDGLAAAEDTPLSAPQEDLGGDGISETDSGRENESGAGSSPETDSAEREADAH